MDYIRIGGMADYAKQPVGNSFTDKDLYDGNIIPLKYKYGSYMFSSEKNIGEYILDVPAVGLLNIKSVFPYTLNLLVVTEINSLILNTGCKGIKIKKDILINSFDISGITYGDMVGIFSDRMTIRNCMVYSMRLYREDSLIFNSRVYRLYIGCSAPVVIDSFSVKVCSSTKEMKLNGLFPKKIFIECDTFTERNDAVENFMCGGYMSWYNGFDEVEGMDEWLDGESMRYPDLYISIKYDIRVNAELTEIEGKTYYHINSCDYMERTGNGKYILRIYDSKSK